MSPPLMDKDMILAPLTTWSGTTYCRKSSSKDQVGIEPLRVVSQHGEFEIETQFPQPIEEIPNAGGPFEMKEVVAVGGGGTHEIGYMDTRVLYGLAVPVGQKGCLCFGCLANHRPCVFEISVTFSSSVPV